MVNLNINVLIEISSRKCMHGKSIAISEQCLSRAILINF